MRDASLMTKAGPSPSLDQLGLGITAEQLRRIPDIVGIGGGLEKAAAIASFCERLIKHPCTDAGVLGAYSPNACSTALNSKRNSRPARFVGQSETG